MNIGTLAGSVGRGLAAGAAGTAAMTVSSTLEAKLRKREPSTAPADAAAKVLGIRPEGEEQKARFSSLVHWGYGTSWGAVRGILGGLGLVGPIGTAAHFALVWGSELTMLPKLEVAAPVKRVGNQGARHRRLPPHGVRRGHWRRLRVARPPGHGIAPALVTGDW